MPHLPIAPLTTLTYTLSLHDALPISLAISERTEMDRWIISRLNTTVKLTDEYLEEYEPTRAAREIEHFVEELSNWYILIDRKSTRLNSSHVAISYAVFCLKKKKE